MSPLLAWQSDLIGYQIQFVYLNPGAVPGAPKPSAHIGWIRGIGTDAEGPTLLVQVRVSEGYDQLWAISVNKHRIELLSPAVT